MAESTTADYQLLLVHKSHLCSPPQPAKRVSEYNFSTAMPGCYSETGCCNLYHLVDCRGICGQAQRATLCAYAMQSVGVDSYHKGQMLTALLGSSVLLVPGHIFVRCDHCCHHCCSLRSMQASFDAWGSVYAVCWLLQMCCTIATCAAMPKQAQPTAPQLLACKQRPNQ